MEKFPPTFENSPEKQAESFKNRLDNIFNTQLNVENIHDFADDAMNKLIKLIDEVKSAYQKETNSNLTGKDLEDKAFEHYNLRGIIKLLDKIQEKSEQIAEIYQYIKEIPKINKLIVPPNKSNPPKIKQGDHDWYRKDIIPRLSTLLYILETDFNIPKEEITIVEGIVSNEQLRTEPYYRVEINELNRLVYVCIEAENVTYIFDQEKLKENHIEVELMDILTKQERNDALEQYPNLGTKLKQSKYWRENISELLAAEKLEYKTAPTIEKETNNTENIPKISTSEFDEWRGFWTDPEGKHWGNYLALSKRMKLSPDTIQKKLENIPSIKIKNRQGKSLTSYCYEDLIQIPKIKKLINSPAVAKENNPKKNQWENFWTDQKGNHWTNCLALANYISLTNHIDLTEGVLRRHLTNIPCEKTKDKRGKVCSSYCYEDLIKRPEIQELINNPTVAKEDNFQQNQWKGFWTDLTDPDNPKHWTNIGVLSRHIDVKRDIIEMYTVNLPSIKTKNRKGKSLTSYCYEDLIQIPDIQELLRKKKLKEENQEG